MKTVSASPLAALFFAAATLTGSAVASPSNLSISVTPATASATVVQDEEVEDKREVVKELVKRFEGHIKKKGKEDTEAVAVIDELLQEFSVSGPKDRVSIVKALDKAFGLKRKDHEDGSKEARVVMAAAICLGEMGPESVKPLIKLTDGKKTGDNNELLRRIVLSLGKTAHEDAVKPLLKVASHKLPVIQGAGIEALGEFRDVDQKDRKKIVEQLIKMIMPIKSTVDTDSEDITARERYDVIGPPTITTLQRLSDQNIRDFQEWQQWWNKNKNKDWDEDDG